MEEIGFVIGKIVGFIIHNYKKTILLIILLLSVFIFLWIKNILRPIPPDVCACALNTLKVRTVGFDSVFQKNCEKYSATLSNEKKQERDIKSAECPEVKAELERQENEKEEHEKKRLFLLNCTSSAAQSFVRNRFRDIGTAILDGPYLVDSDNANCYYVFSVIAQKDFAVVGCEMAVKYNGDSFEVEYVNCQ